MNICDPFITRYDDDENIRLTIKHFIDADHLPHYHLPATRRNHDRGLSYQIQNHPLIRIDIYYDENCKDMCILFM